MTTITYITIDETHRIEVMPSGNHYPQHLTHPQLKDYSEGWSYWKTGNKQKSFKTEKAARIFITNCN